MTRLIYSIIGYTRIILNLKRPFFSKDKYSEFCLKSPDLAAGFILNSLNQTSTNDMPWFDRLDGKELFQTSKYEYHFRDKKDYGMMSEWVEWRKKK